VDRVAYGRESDEADRALASLVHSCGLDRHLYRLSPLARVRISRRLGHSAIQDTASAAQATTDAVLADAMAQAISDGITQLTTELVKLLRYEYRIESIAAGHQHDGTSSHHGGYSDPGAGHHSH
jgi:hypothetical protein